MYFRRKLLLALIEIFGGSLSETDCYKLMFLFCQRTGQNYYDFFPHRFGSYSLVLNQDKLRLIDLGYLKQGEAFELSPSRGVFQQLDMFVQNELRLFAQEIGKLRGKKLLKMAYTKFPNYAARSEIAPRILSPDQYAQIMQTRNEDTSPHLFTIGYEGTSIDKYLNTLIEHNIVLLVDVRKNPISRKYGFSKHQLQKYTGMIGVKYLHFPQLGIPSDMRQDLDSPEAYQDLFEIYVREILPDQPVILDKLREIIYENKRVALTCFEADYTSCHRSKVAEYFQKSPNFDIPIEHL